MIPLLLVLFAMIGLVFGVFIAASAQEDAYKTVEVKSKKKKTVTTKRVVNETFVKNNLYKVYAYGFTLVVLSILTAAVAIIFGTDSTNNPANLTATYEIYVNVENTVPTITISESGAYYYNIYVKEDTELGTEYVLRELRIARVTIIEISDGSSPRLEKYTYTVTQWDWPGNDLVYYILYLPPTN